MSQYNVKILSRRIYPGPEPESVSSFYSLTGMCHFEDDSEDNNDFNIYVVSDYARMNQTVEYTSSQISNNSQTGIDKKVIRNNIKIFGREGFYGTFFQYFINRVIPVSGLFAWDKAKVESIKTNLDVEFISGFGTVNNGGITI